MQLIEALIYTACMPAECTSVDRANFGCLTFLVENLISLHIYIIFCVNYSCQCLYWSRMLILSHKSPVVRRSVAQRTHGLYRLKVRAYGITSCALPPFSGGRDPVISR